MQYSGMNMSGDSLAATLAFNGQCFLIQNMFDLSKKAEEALDRVDGMPARYIERLRRDQQSGTYRHTPRGAFELSGLRYIAPILSNSTYKPPQTYSKLVAGKNARQLLDLTTDKMAMLVPKLRIFKVEYEAIEDRDGFLRPDYENGQDIEVIFDDFVKKESIEKMFEVKGGRLGGHGIKGFKWSLKGVNPADVDANITAELTLHFNDVADVFKSADGTAYYKAGRPGKATFLDLIVHAPASVNRGTTPESPRYMIYDGKFFEIKAEVGWAVPLRAGTGEIFTEDERDAIREAQTPLYMQLTKHQFNFNQDGSADLIINYRARYGYREKQFDLIGLSDSGAATRVTEIEERIKEYNAQAEEQTNETAEAHYEDELEEAQENLDDELHERYNKLLAALVGSTDPLHPRPCKLLATYASALQMRLAQEHEVNGDWTPREMTGGEVRGLFKSARLGKERLGYPKRDPDDPEVDLHSVARAGYTGRGAAPAISTRAASEDFFISLTGEAGAHGSMSAALREKFFEATDVMTYAEFVASSTAGSMAMPTAADPESLTMGQIQLTHERYDDDADAEMAIARKLSRSAMGGQRTKTGYRAPRDYYQANASYTSIREKGHGTLGPGKQIGVPFFLLGDLIDSVIEASYHPASGDRPAAGIGHEIARGRLALATLDLQFFNLKLFYKTAASQGHGRGGANQFFKKIRYRELSFNQTDMNRLYKPINIASLPIQYDFFMEWYLGKVVKPKRQKYYFNHFMADLLTDVVGPMLSARCFYGIPQVQAQLSQLDFMVDKKGDFKKALWPSTRGATFGSIWPRSGPIGDIVNDRLLPAKVTVAPNDAIGPRPLPAPDIHTNVRTIMMTTLGLVALKGDYVEDMANGIYHFKVGLSRGLLKEATFARADAPYLRESRVNRDKFLGAEQLRELYNVTLRLYGCPLLKPGQYIYVTPAPLGFGNPAKKNSPARFLGIGGYHLVTEVNSTIGRSGYETTIKALHQAMPYIAGGPPILVP
jgi:hypothetical protein